MSKSVFAVTSTIRQMSKTISAIDEIKDQIGKTISQVRNIIGLTDKTLLPVVVAVSPISKLMQLTGASLIIVFVAGAAMLLPQV